MSDQSSCMYGWMADGRDWKKWPVVRRMMVMRKVHMYVCPIITKTKERQGWSERKKVESLKKDHQL
jgi:hypothetical protein